VAARKPKESDPGGWGTATQKSDVKKALAWKGGCLVRNHKRGYLRKPGSEAKMPREETPKPGSG